MSVEKEIELLKSEITNKLRETIVSVVAPLSSNIYRFSLKEDKNRFELWLTHTISPIMSLNARVLLCTVEYKTEVSKAIEVNVIKSVCETDDRKKAWLYNKIASIADVIEKRVIEEMDEFIDELKKESHKRYENDELYKKISKNGMISDEYYVIKSGDYFEGIYIYVSTYIL